MKLVGRYPLALAVLLCAICLGESRAELVDSITFDEPQLVDNDPLLQFYNGGTTFRMVAAPTWACRSRSTRGSAQLIPSWESTPSPDSCC